MKKTKCPNCGSDVIVPDETFAGDLLDCQNCGRELEVVALNPPRLKTLEEAG